jgi:hypothetical protein
VILVSLLFGGWHCLAWNFSFPTVAEKQFWRVSAILGTITLPFFFLLAWLSEQTGSRSAILNGMAGSMLPLYLVARLVMIAEMFGGLRKMPARVYETVRWTDFIPQFS